jgi:hypothetical protein
MTRKKFSQSIRILDCKLNQYGNFQIPGIIGCKLEYELLLTLYGWLKTIKPSKSQDSNNWIDEIQKVLKPLLKKL